MEIGLLDVDSHNFPNLVLMKISAYHKANGDNVEWLFPLKHYDIVYVSKVFGDEYTKMGMEVIQADKIINGGTGFAIKIVDGKEEYEKTNDGELPYEIEHIYPDYELYPELTKDKAYGFLTRGCPNKCSFCCVWKKEGPFKMKGDTIFDLEKRFEFEDVRIAQGKSITNKEFFDELKKGGAEE